MFDKISLSTSCGPCFIFLCSFDACCVLASIYGKTHLQPCLAQNKKLWTASHPWHSGCRVIASLCPCFYERFRSNNRVVPTSVARVLASQCCFSSPCTLKVAEVAPESLILPAHSKGSLWMLLRSSTFTFHHLSLSVLTTIAFLPQKEQIFYWPELDYLVICVHLAQTDMLLCHKRHVGARITLWFPRGISRMSLMSTFSRKPFRHFCHRNPATAEVTTL